MSATVPGSRTAVAFPAPADAECAPAAPPGLPRVLRSAELFNGATRLAIVHDEVLYFLSETRSGKLILTK